ncbi:outer membrane protein [Legionella hackeliae]|nr:outer membrane beta-barrel protein [Legionella hackeliae]
MKLIIALSLVSPSLLHASSLNQVYAAINGGIFQANFNSDYLDQTDIIPQNISNSSLQNGYTGGLGIGSTHTFNASAFLGIELTGNIDSNSALYQSGAATTAFSDNIKIRHHVDLTVIPGIMTLGSFFPYLKLGVSYASLRDKLISPVGYNPVMTQYQSNKNVYGFAAALGVKHPVNEHLGVFAEANYHDYGNITFSNFQNFSANYSHSAHLYTYGLVVGASYAINI